MNHNIHVLSRALILHNDHLLLAYDPREEPKHYYELEDGRVIAQIYY